MTLNTTAVYENGFLRTPSPLPLNEGETVQLVVTRAAYRPSDEEILAMMKAAKSPEELFAIADAHTTAPDGCARRTRRMHKSFSTIRTMPTCFIWWVS